MSDETCCECGLRVVPGEPSCDARRDQLLVRDYEHALFWPYHRMAIDAYCLQHAKYVESPKSFAAHLCGLCIAMEHNNDASLLRRVQQLWLSTNPTLQKPALPLFRGELTVGDVCDIDDPVEYGRAVNSWARSVWRAYSELHPLAEEWVNLGSSQHAPRR